MMRKTVIALLLFLLLVSSAVAGDLADVQEAGTLRFGAFPGTRPFIYYDNNDDLTGIDIKLMEEITSRMGVELEVFELSYDSLMESLEIGQTDVIGGAFSRTEARKKEIDFTKIYYTAGAVFAGPKDLKMAEPLSEASFAGKKIGVKRGTSFEEWLKTGLAGDGTVKTKDIYLFADNDSAVRALDRGRVDLILIDEDSFAGSYQNSGKYAAFQYGSAKDSYAFGVRKDSDLKAEIDKHLSAMLKDGTAQQIADSFFSAPEEEETLIQWSRPAQTATPLPTAPLSLPQVQTPTSALQPTVFTIPTAAPTATAVKCSWSMGYVGDVTIPDGTQIPAGNYFTKIWRIKNTGNCPWTTDFTFSFVSGSQMSGSNRYLSKVVYPGDSVDISVDMYAPATPGTYKGNWQLKTNTGYAVGPAIWVQISVPGSYSYPTATPDYSSAVQPSVKPVILWYYPNFYTQPVGKCVNLYWGLDVFSTAELFVDGTSVYFGSDDTHMITLCNEVSWFGPHEIKLCAYAAGGQTCETVTYVTDPAGTPFSP